MPPAIYRTGLVIAHLCLNVIAFLCLVTLLLVGDSKSNVMIQSDDLNNRLHSLIMNGPSSPTEFLRALDGEKIVQDHNHLSTYSTSRRHFFVRDGKLVEVNWQVFLKQQKPTLNGSYLHFEVKAVHEMQEMNVWQAVKRILPNGPAFRSTNSSFSVTSVSFPLTK